MTEREKELLDKGEMLPLLEDFYTLQGEGFHAGKAAYFIRVGGCDIGCKWCDTKFSWNPEIHTLTDVNDIVKKISSSTAITAVITGGEPLLYNMNPLCKKLNEAGIETFIETSGAYAISGTWDWFCLSPKKHNSPEQKIFDKADELKVIIFSEEDFEWAEECSKKVSKKCKLFLQPEWSNYEILIDSVVKYILKNPKWEISLQMHKFMHIP